MISGTKPSQRVAILERQVVWLERRTRELAGLVDILDERSGACRNCGARGLVAEMMNPYPPYQRRQSTDPLNKHGWRWDCDPRDRCEQPEEDLFDWDAEAS